MTRLIRFKMKYRFWGTALEGTRQVFSFTELWTEDSFQSFINDELVLKEQANQMASNSLESRLEELRVAAGHAAREETASFKAVLRSVLEASGPARAAVEALTAASGSACSDVLALLEELAALLAGEGGAPAESGDLAEAAAAAVGEQRNVSAQLQRACELLATLAATFRAVTAPAGGAAGGESRSLEPLWAALGALEAARVLPLGAVVAQLAHVHASLPRLTLAAELLADSLLGEEAALGGDDAALPQAAEEPLSSAADAGGGSAAAADGGGGGDSASTPTGLAASEGGHEGRESAQGQSGAEAACRASAGDLLSRDEVQDDGWGWTPAAVQQPQFAPSGGVAAAARPEAVAGVGQARGEDPIAPPSEAQLPILLRRLQQPVALGERPSALRNGAAGGTGAPATSSRQVVPNAHALSALQRVALKLSGTETSLRSGRHKTDMAVPEHIDWLVGEATSMDNLVHMYEGWVPWL